MTRDFRIKLLSGSVIVIHLPQTETSIPVQDMLIQVSRDGFGYYDTPTTIRWIPAHQIVSISVNRDESNPEELRLL